MTAVRGSIWEEKAALLILRSIVCEMPLCCPKRVTAALIRSDFPGVRSGGGCRGWLSRGADRKGAEGSKGR